MRLLARNRRRLPLVGTADTWTPRTSGQPRKVSRVERGTVQTSYQMITRGMNFCPILLGVPRARMYFGQTIGWGENEGISLAKQFDRLRGFATPPHMTPTQPRFLLATNFSANFRPYMLSEGTWTASSGLNLGSIDKRLMCALINMLTLRWL